MGVCDGGGVLCQQPPGLVREEKPLSRFVSLPQSFVNIRFIWASFLTAGYSCIQGLHGRGGGRGLTAGAVERS